MRVPADTNVSHARVESYPIKLYCDIHRQQILQKGEIVTNCDGDVYSTAFCSFASCAEHVNVNNTENTEHTKFALIMHKCLVKPLTLLWYFDFC